MCDSSTPLDGYTIWDNHVIYPVECWMREVGDDNTRLGYWAWVRHQIELEVEEGYE